MYYPIIGFQYWHFHFFPFAKHIDKLCPMCEIQPFQIPNQGSNHRTGTGPIVPNPVLHCSAKWNDLVFVILISHSISLTSRLISVRHRLIPYTIVNQLHIWPYRDKLSKKKDNKCSFWQHIARTKHNKVKQKIVYWI